MKAAFPGLNAPLLFDRPNEPISIIEQTDEEREASLRIFRSKVEKMGKKKRRFAKDKLHPLERGFRLLFFARS
jgi:hypothetical protein